MKLENLKQELKKAGVDLPDLDIDKLRTYAVLLKEWNEKINLTSIVEEDDVAEKHFLDSLLPCALTDFSNKKIVDIGSGAGFPGMVIALAFPTSQVTLVDSTQKKFLFLEEVKKTLQIGNVFFKIGRVEDMKAEKQSFDLVTSRGFSSLPTFLEVGAPLCKVDGQLIAMRGSKGKEELKESSNAMEILGLRYERKQATTLPSNGDIRLNYLLHKHKPTSSKYPREWAKIIKHPL